MRRDRFQRAWPLLAILAAGCATQPQPTASLPAPAARRKPVAARRPRLPQAASAPLCGCAGQRNSARQASRPIERRWRPWKKGSRIPRGPQSRRKRAMYPVSCLPSSWTSTKPCSTTPPRRHRCFSMESAWRSSRRPGTPGSQSGARRPSLALLEFIRAARAMTDPAGRAVRVFLITNRECKRRDGDDSACPQEGDTLGPTCAPWASTRRHWLKTS